MGTYLFRFVWPISVLVGRILISFHFQGNLTLLSKEISWNLVSPESKGGIQQCYCILHTVSVALFVPLSVRPSGMLPWPRIPSLLTAI